MDLHNFIKKVKEDTNWKNESRIVGEACEEYIKNNINCVRCDNNNFEKCKTNENQKT